MQRAHAGPGGRVPKQARARERRARILDAARAEIEERAPSEITMEGIARRAGVPVGSLYQYFDNKTSLFAAVGASVMDDADALVARLLVECRSLPWREAVDRTADAVLGVLRRSPHYRRVLRAVRFTDEFAELTAASNERVADLMSLHPAFSRAGLGRAKALEICRTVIIAANALQDRVLADEILDRDAWVEETKRLVKGYLGTYLP